MKIPIGVVGRIQNGTDADMQVRVSDDQVNTGGFIVYTWWKNSGGPNTDGAFDDWVESKEQLEDYFTSTGWIIEWQHTAARSPR